MAHENAADYFSRAKSQLTGGAVLDFLRHNQFPAWVVLASNSLLELELAKLVVVDQDTIRQQEFRNRQVLALAQRLILSRQASLFLKLRPLWREFGSSDANCDRIEGAIQTALDNWPHEITKAGGSSTCLTFSTAHAVFIETLQEVANSDTAGVLGKAIRTSRLADERAHVGFPMVLCGNSNSSLRDGFWITPKASWTSKLDSEVEKRWNNLYRRAYSSTFGTEPSDNPDVSLPDWLQQLDWDVKTLESAGFALAMQMIARQAKVNLPYGVGFTGRWEDGQLRGVRDIGIKLQAAREAGVFLMFACADADQNESIPEPIEGARLVLLPDGLCLRDVVRYVNRVCADSGITEYRWREAEKRFSPTTLRFRLDRPEKFEDTIAKSLAGSRNPGDDNPDLPDVFRNGELCPFGFIGREQALKQLRDAVSTPPASRSLIPVLASPGSGKTTLLSRFASEQTPYPIWFSFRREEPLRRSLPQLQQALFDQIRERFCTIAMPTLDSTDAGLEEETRLKTLMTAVTGRVDILVDGIDEADNPQNVLKWLRTVPGIGYVIVGSQPQIFDRIKPIPIELINDTESGLADARLLIRSCADKFSTFDRLRSIGERLRENDWIDGLSTKSGGNLWILNDFLRAVERDNAGWWPSVPSEVPLSDNIVEYARILINLSLEDYPDSSDERSTVEMFLNFLSFLDDRSWAVADVRELTGTTSSGVSISAWSGSGLLTKSVRRVLEFNGSHCRFWSPLTQRAVQRNCEGIKKDVAKRFIGFIKKPHSAKELSEHLIERLSYLLTEVGDTKLTDRLLFKTSWLHRRLRMLVCQGQPVSTLSAELQSLIPSAPTKYTSKIVKMVDWLSGWGGAINKDGELIDQWWDSAGEVTKPFPRDTDSQKLSISKLRLLVPIVGSNIADQRYDVPWPTSARYHGASCEIFDEGTSYLVFSISQSYLCYGGLLVFRKTKQGYTRERFIRLSEDGHVFSLAPLQYPEVAALVRRHDGECELTVFDVTSGKTCVIKSDPRIISLASLRTDPTQLVVVHCEENEDKFSPARVSILDRQGQVTAEKSIPFVVSSLAYLIQAQEFTQITAENLDHFFSTIEIVPFAIDCFCLLGRYESDEKTEKRIKWYRIQNSLGSNQVVELQELELGQIQGACALPRDCLAVVHEEKETRDVILSVVNASVDVELKITLYKNPRMSDGGSISMHGDFMFFLTCRPAGWHERYGLIITSDYKSHEGVYAVQLEQEAIARKRTWEDFLALDKLEFSIPPERVASISEGRILSVFSAGSVVLGTDNKDIDRIERGAKSASPIELFGSRADGVLLIYADYGFQYAIPRSRSLATNDLSSETNIRITHDGWELTWDSESVLTGRKQGGPPVFSWSAADVFGETGERVRILDVIDRWPLGGIWVAVKHAREIVAILLSLDDQCVLPQKISIWYEKNRQDSDVEFQDASGSLLAYRIINSYPDPFDPNYDIDADHTGEFDFSFVKLIRLEHGQLESWFVPDEGTIEKYDPDEMYPVTRNTYRDYAFVTILYLAGGVSIVHRSGVGNTVFVHFPESGVIERPDLNISDRLMVLQRDDHGNEVFVHLASIIEQDGRWALSLCTLWIEASTELAKLLSSNEIDLVGEVLSWDHSEKYLALAYATGRIEIRCCRKPDTIVAVCYTVGQPHDVRLIHRDEGDFLAVLDDPLSWFQLP